MKTIFKQGMKVYDQVFFPDMEGTIEEVNVDAKYSIVVSFGEEEYTGLYNLEGTMSEGFKPTLSTKPYEVEFKGFEQKAPKPTYDSVRAEALKKGDYVAILNGLELPDELIVKSFEALAKLIWMVDYYNEGWKPDFSGNIKETKYCISKDETGRFMRYDYYNRNFNNILIFKSKEIRSAFWDEQLHLMQAAKFLL